MVKSHQGDAHWIIDRISPDIYKPKMALKNKSVFPVEEVHFTRIDAGFLKNGKWLETRMTCLYK